MQFSNIIGHESIKQRLIASVQQDRIPHAQLFIGQEGVGALPLAVAYAQLLQCLNPQMRGACEQCTACTKAAKYIHPDIHFSFPTVGAQAESKEWLVQWRKALIEQPYFGRQDWLNLYLNAENKQLNITAKECNEITRKLSLKAYEGKRKVLVMWLPEYLGKDGNRLLKLIEEPPADTVFLLVAESIEQILITILSRCQTVKLFPLEDKLIAQALIEQQQVSEAEAYMTAYLAEGNYNLALSYSDEKNTAIAERMAEFLRACYQDKTPAHLRWAEDLAASGREAQKYFFQYVLHFLRELQRVRYLPEDYKPKLRPAESQTARALAKFIREEDVTAWENIVGEALTHIERNANGKLLLLNAIIRLHHVLTNANRREKTSQHEPQKS